MNCSDCHTSYISKTGRNLTTRLTEHKLATRKGDVNNHIAEHHRLMNHTIDWDSAQCLTFSTNYFQQWSWKADLLTWNRLPSTGVNHYRHHTNDSFTTLIHDKWTQQNHLTSLTDPNWPIMTDVHHLSLAANNIMAKLTNQFLQTGLSTFDWQQSFTWLWWWLLLRLSKSQSPLLTTVLLRTTHTWMIQLHYYKFSLPKEKIQNLEMNARYGWKSF